MQIINQPSATNGDEQLFVQFYTGTVQNKHRSEQEGRPIFDECDMVRIQAPGDMLTVVDRECWDGDKRRFPRQWQAYEASKMGREMQVGTPIDQWPAMSRSQAEELKALKFMTVESIAHASDQQLQRIGMGGYGLRTKAQAYLQAAQDTALVQSQAAELQRRDAEIQDLRAQMQRLATAVEEKRGRGRPRNTDEVAA